MLRIPFGFTVIELLLALVLAGILLAAAIPSFHHMLVRNRVVTQVQQLTAALQFARSEAIKRGEIVIFCKSADHKTCGGQWRDGQIVIAKGAVLRVVDPLPAGDDLRLFGSRGENEALEFLPQGFTNGQQGSFYYCPTDKTYAMRIVFEQTGRIRVEQNASGC